MTPENWEKLTPDEKSTISRFVAQQTGKPTPPIEIIRHLNGSDHQLDDDQIDALRVAAAGEMITNNLTGELRILVKKPAQMIPLGTATPVTTTGKPWAVGQGQTLGPTVDPRADRKGKSLQDMTRDQRRVEMERRKVEQQRNARKAQKPIPLMGSAWI